MNKNNLIILGSGPAGLTAAIYAARAELNPLLLEGTTPGGQLMWTTEVENFPGFDNAIMGPELMNKMRLQASKYGTHIASESCKKLIYNGTGDIEIHTDTTIYHTKAVIIATGATAKWLNLGKNEERYWGKGYTACAVCDGAFYKNRVVAVVGGGDSACEEAHFLTRYASKVYMLVRGESMRASVSMKERVFEDSKIEVLYNTEVDDIYGTKFVEGIKIRNNKDNRITDMTVDGVFCAIGHTPNTAFLEGILPLTDTKYIIPTGHTGTILEGVFVAGDVSDYRYRQAITAAGAGCMAALDAEKWLLHHK